jgi:mono/diheme cytochrome c family protein
VVCHTGPDGKPFAGGLKMGTPLGAVYSTNITPDKETGIGNDSFEDFERAMRDGVAKDGHRLYPAMPYPSYAKVSEEDLRALYAFFMGGVTPVRRENARSEIPWPLDMRWPLAIWDAVFTDRPGYAPKDDRDAKWNRGAYLVQGLGHCGSCHTPRGVFFQEKALDGGRTVYLSGGELDNWSASDLRQDFVVGLGRWTEADIVEFLKTGHNRRATAFGTMIDAVNNSTQYLTDEDLGAIAAYLKSLPGRAEPAGVAYVYDAGATDALRKGEAEAPGAGIYVQKCAGCHALDGLGRGPFLPPLAGNAVILDDDPSSLVNVVLNGSARIVVGGMPDEYRMPQFRLLLGDRDIAQVLGFVRRSWGNDAAPVPLERVARIRKQTEPASDSFAVLKMR